LLSYLAILDYLNNSHDCYEEGQHVFEHEEGRLMVLLMMTRSPTRSKAIAVWWLILEKSAQSNNCGNCMSRDGKSSKTQISQQPRSW
jgi:hypothetical protein